MMYNIGYEVWYNIWYDTWCCMWLRNDIWSDPDDVCIEPWSEYEYQLEY